MKKFYLYARSLNATFWGRVVESTTVSEKSLGIFRWIFGLFMLFFSPAYASLISEAPSAFFDPPYISIANLIGQFPPYPFFLILDIVVLISLLLLTIGIKSRWFSAIMLICWIISSDFATAFGKIDHGTMPKVVLFCMIFSNWGSYYALIPDRRLSPIVSRKSLAILGVVLAFGFFTAGYEKALKWIDFDFNTSGFFSWFYRGYFDFGKDKLLAPAVFLVPQWIFEFADYGAVIFELSAFITLLISRQWWLYWLMGACIFHIANTLLLNISFVTYFVVYMAFVDFNKLNQQLLNLGRSSVIDRLKYFLTGLAVILFLRQFLPKLAGKSAPPADTLRLGLAVYLVTIVVILAELLISRKFEQTSQKRREQT